MVRLACRVGNTGGFSLANEGEANVMSDYMPGSPIYGGNVDLSSTANGIVTIPDGQELVFKDGMPYLQRREKKIADIDHKQPLSFGVSVRKNLAKGFSVESGLTYTYLASDVRYEGSSEKIARSCIILAFRYGPTGTLWMQRTLRCTFRRGCH